MSNIIPEGFKDDVTFQVETEHKFKNIIIKLFQISGFKLIKTPLIEYNESDLNDNIFKLSTKKNEKELIIRDDITMQVARLSQTRLLNKNRPLKLCYYGEVVRKRGTMLRPERQFLQIGAECIGESSYLADVEMMDLAYSALNAVGIKDITIEISSRIFFDYFINSFKSLKLIYEIKRLVKLKDLNSLLKVLDKKKHSYIKNIFACTGEYRNKKKYLDKLSIDLDTSNEVKNLKNIVNNFSKSNKDVKFFIDLCEIDDKNYHSGIRFTFFANDIRGEIAKGGRYLVKNLNQNDEATGFTCYMDSILRASSFKQIKKKIMIPFKTDKIKIKKLIKQGYTVIKHFNDIKNIKSKSQEQNCKFYLEKNLIKKN